MLFRELDLRAQLPEQIATEIMFEIASAKVDGVELLCFQINNKEDLLLEKYRSTILRNLKKMKSDGAIQLFATSESFKTQKTEAYFLQNKYPTIFNSISDYSEIESKIYIKI